MAGTPEVGGPAAVVDAPEPAAVVVEAVEVEEPDDDRLPPEQPAAAITAAARTSAARARGRVTGTGQGYRWSTRCRPRSPIGSVHAVERIGIRRLRAEVAALVRRAGGGERLVITVGGRPVAQLGPLEPGRDDLTLDDLAAKGLLQPARRDDRPGPSMTLPLWAGTRIDQLVREVRGR